MDDKSIECLIQSDENISADNEKIRIAFFANIGFFIEVAQMLEFNIRKLICYHKSVTEIESGDITKERVESICEKYDEYYLKTYEDKFTLGRLKNELEKIPYIEDDMHGIFDEINDYRVLIVHKVFQINIFGQGLKDSKTVYDYIKSRLIPMTDKTVAINKFLINCINSYKEDLHAYKQQVGIKIEGE